MRYLLLFSAASTGLLLSGCIGPMAKKSEPQPAPVVEPAPVPDKVGSEAMIAAYRPPVQPTLTRPEPAKAVQVLMRRAEDQKKTGDYTAAAGSLERAIRIEPRNPVLWNQLAHLRMEQKHYDVAADLAAKSNVFVTQSDGKLKRDNWSIIAAARRAVGDTAGARAAQQKADELN